MIDKWYNAGPIQHNNVQINQTERNISNPHSRIDPYCASASSLSIVPYSLTSACIPYP